MSFQACCPSWFKKKPLQIHPSGNELNSGTSTEENSLTFSVKSVYSQAIQESDCVREIGERKLLLDKKIFLDEIRASKIKNVLENSVKATEKNTVTQRIKRFFVLSVRAPIYYEKSLQLTDFDINKVAAEYNIKTLNGFLFLRNVLSSFSSPEEALSLVAKAEQASVLTSMVNDKVFLNSPEFLAGEENFNKSIAACRQGLKISSDLFSVGPLVVYEALNKEAQLLSHIKIRFVRELGKGSENKVILVWTGLNKFMVLRQHMANKEDLYPNITPASFSRVSKTSSGLIIPETKYVENVYEQLKEKLPLKDLELIEEPDCLLKREDGMVFALRELAVRGDLNENRSLFILNPGLFLEHLLRPIVFLNEVGFAMRDVKAGNINVHQNTAKKPMAKYSDVGGGVSLDLAVDALTKTWTTFKEEMERAYPDRWEFIQSMNEMLEEALITVDEFGPRNYFPSSLDRAYKEFATECNSIYSFGTTAGYTIADRKEQEGIGRGIQALLYQTFFQYEDNENSPDIKDCVQVIVNRMQVLDIRGAGMTMVRYLLGKGSYKSYNLKRLLQIKALNISECELMVSRNKSEGKQKETLDNKNLVSSDCRAEICSYLKKKQRMSPIGGRLSDDSIALIVDMAAGQVSPNKEGMVRIQEVIYGLL
jgi:hypothetical protein